MVDDLIEALGEALRRLEEGLDVSDRWLQERLPGRWTELRAALGVDRRLRKLAPEGTRLAGYRLLRRLGEGGMGVVHLAELPGSSPRELVAIKSLHPHVLARPDAARRFLREAEIGRKIRDRRIVATIGAGVEESGGRRVHYVITEFVEGRTLREFLDGLPDGARALSEDFCRHIGAEVAGALDVLHRAGIVHRDVKPENVMIDRSDQVRLMDLGLAYAPDEARRISASGMFVGSLAYAAPEQIVAHDQRIDGRADLYALGVVLWELATGRHPLADTMPGLSDRRLPSLRREQAPVSRFFDAFVSALLAPAPRNRLASAALAHDCLVHGEASAWWQTNPLRSDAADAARTAAQEMPFVGRTDVLEGIDAAWESAGAGAGRVVVVTGAPGVGRTRTLDEIAARIGSDPAARIVRIAFPPGPSRAGAGPVLEGFRRLVTDARLASAAAASGLRTLAGTDTSPGEPTERRVIVAKLVRFARTVALAHPLLVLADDVQSASEEGLALVGALAAAAADRAIVLVAASSPHPDDDWLRGVLRLSAAREVRLPPLTPEETAALVALRYEDPRGADELASDLAPAAGNPAFLREILRGLEGSGRIARDGDRWTVRGAAARTIPQSVRGMLEERLARLPDQDLATLRLAACLGREFDADRLAAAGETTRMAVLRSLSRVRRTPGLLRSTGDASAFESPMARDVVYESMPVAVRRALHAKIAACLAVHGGPSGPRRKAATGDLAGHVWHAVRAGQEADVLGHACAAVSALARRHDNERATEIAVACLAVRGGFAPAARAEMLLDLALLHDRAGLRDAEMRTLGEALRCARRAGRARLVARARLRLGMLQFERGDYRAAARTLRAARRAGLTSLAGPERLRATETLARCEMRRGRVGAARVLYTEALRTARRARDPSGELGVEVGFAALERRTGRVGPALERLRRAYARLDGTVDREVAARITGNLGLMLSSTGERVRAIPLLRRQVELAREIGSRPLESLARTTLPDALAALGRLAEADRACAECARFASEIGAGDVAAIADAAWAGVSATLGRVEVARAKARAAVAGADAAGHEVLRRFATVRRARIETNSGDAAAARADFLQVVEKAGGGPEIRHVADAHLRLGVSDLERGDVAAARVHLTAALSTAVDAGEGDVESLASAYLRLACRIDGADESALVPPGPEMGAPDQVEWDWTVWRATGDRRRLDAAFRTLSRLRRHAPAEDRRTMVTRVPLHRAVWDAWHGGDAEAALDRDDAGSPAHAGGQSDASGQAPAGALPSSARSRSSAASRRSRSIDPDVSS